MKKLIIFIFLLALGYSSNAQDKPSSNLYKHVFKFNPPQFFFNTMNLSYEYRPDFTKSFQFSFGITYKDRAQSNYYSNKDYVQGLAGECQIRLYPLAEEQTSKNFYNNFYISPYLQYKNFYIKDYNYYDNNYLYDGNNNINSYYVQSSERFNVYSLGILTGINNVINKRFHLDIYFGGGIRLSDSKDYTNNIFDYGFKGISPRVGFDIGINIK